MPTLEAAQISFINSLVHAKGTADEFSKRSLERDVDIDKVRDQLDELVEVDAYDKKGKVIGKEKVPLRESMRRDMTFTLVDRKGKKHEKSFSDDGQVDAADSYDSTAKGHFLSEEDTIRVNKALEKALSLVENMRKKVKLKPDGTPVLDEKTGNPVPFYSDRELMDEIFTPMVREGLIPDNLLIDKFSATSELLKNTIDKYKDTLESVERAKTQKRNEAATDRTGANGIFKRGVALYGKAAEIREDMESKLASKIGEVNLRRMKLAAESAQSIKDFVSENKDDIGDLLAPGLGKIKELVPKECIDFLKSVKGAVIDPLKDAAAGPRELFDQMKDKLIGEQILRVQALYNRIAEQGANIKDELKSKDWVAKATAKVDKLLDQVQKVQDLPFISEAVNFYEENQENLSDAYDDVVDELKESVSELSDQGKEFGEILEEEEKVNRLERAEKAAKAAVHEIDQTLTAAVQKVAAKAGVAMAGVYLSSVNLGAVAEYATAVPPEGVKIVDALAAGFPAAFESITPDDMDDTSAFDKIGAAVAKNFRSKADGTKLAKDLETNPGAAFGGIVAAAQAAAAKELDFDPKTATGDAAAFAAQIKDEAVSEKMLGKGAIPNEDEVLKDLEKSDEELREYQNDLILLDEGGEAAKGASSIEKMIADLKKQRQILELVASLGTALVGASSAGASAGFKIANVATSAAAPTIVSGMLAAAKLVIKLAVNTKKAADRWILWYKFRDTLAKSRKANSALSSTIKGFFNNKREQITFHTIEDALIAVQIAGSIVGSVPEPITAAVGQSLVLSAEAATIANDIAGKVFNEAMLTRAWNTTVAAIKNPNNRVQGLKALQRNPTLGMHAIAWAGVQRQPPDPIARHLMDQLGINEKTIAAGANEEKVRDYLTELLNEDRQVLTTGVISLDWLPQDYALSAVDFFKIANRATLNATPKLKKAGEDKVCAALKPLADHNLIEMKNSARAGRLDPTDIQTSIAEANQAKKALLDYKPLSESNSPQEDMADVAAEFVTMTTSHIKELERINTEGNTGRAKVKKSIEDLQAALKDIEDQKDGQDEPALRQLSANSAKCIDEVRKDAWITSNPNVITALTLLATATADLNKKLSAAQPTS